MKPSPNWNATITIFKFNFSVSATGCIIGTNIAAFDVADGIKGFNIATTIAIPMFVADSGKNLNGFVKTYTIVWITFPSLK